MQCYRIAAVAALVVSAASPALAQQWTERFFFTFNAGAQVTGSDLSDRITYELNLETATTEARYPFKPGLLFDAGGVVRIWKKVGAGISVSYFTVDGRASTTSQLPHPFFDNRNREAVGDVDGVTRTETAVHAQIVYLIRHSNRLRFAISAGPSYFDAERELVHRIRYTDEFPFDSVTFTGGDTRRGRGTGIGFNAGVDAMWMLKPRLGAGAMVRITRASLDVGGPDNRRVDIDAGGVQVGLGLRVFF